MLSPASRATECGTLFPALEVICCVDVKVFSWLGEFERLCKFIFIHNPVSLSGAPTCRNVFDRFRSKNDQLAILRDRLGLILNHEPFHVELPHHESLWAASEADETNFLMRLAFRLLFLWRIDGLVFDLNVFAVQD